MTREIYRIIIIDILGIRRGIAMYLAITKKPHVNKQAILSPVEVDLTVVR